VQACEPAVALRNAGLRKRVQNDPMNITVKNLSESVYRVIKREAKRKRRSLNAEIIQALEMEAARLSDCGSSATYGKSWNNLRRRCRRSTIARP
jgi:hypothetical protein